MPKSYPGSAIEITFDARLCIHSRNCVLGQAAVFDSDAQPWIRPDNAAAEEIAATIRSCPSGALTFRRLDGGTDEQVPVLNRVRLRENGPLELTGDLDIAGTRVTRATLCRCGASGNMPFCDTSHHATGFSATGEAHPKIEDQPFDVSAATLTVGVVENGPLMLSGPVEVVSGTGHRIARRQKQAFCRCGRSRNKPFCDGSHNPFRPKET